MNDFVDDLENDVSSQSDAKVEEEKKV